MESPIGNECLNASLLPLLPSQSELSSHLGGIPVISSNQVNADLTKHNVALGPAPAGKRTTALRQSTPTPKKRMSVIGVASSHGRLYKVLGDLFLLAGRISDAFAWCVALVSQLQHLFSSVQVHGGVAVIKKLSRSRLACIRS